MENEGLKLAEYLTRKLGLRPGQYEMEKQGDYYQFYIPTTGKRRLKFGSVTLRRDGLVTVYANGDFVDVNNRFTRQQSKPKDAWLRFRPDDEGAWDYAAGVVLSAYNSRA